MKINIKKFQDGGVAPAAGAPTDQSQQPADQGQGQDPLVQIAQMAMQALQNKDCNAAMQVCAAFVQMLQQSQQQGQGTGQAPEGEPVYRRGGKLVKRIK